MKIYKTIKGYISYIHSDITKKQQKKPHNFVQMEIEKLFIQILSSDPLAKLKLSNRCW